MADATHDADFLKRTVGDALVRGMTRMVLEQPEDSVDFLGHFLLDHVEAKQAGAVKAAREAEGAEFAEAEAAERREAAAAQAEADEVARLVAGIRSSDGVEGGLQPLLEHIRKATGAGAVYLGVKESTACGRAHIRYLEATAGSAMRGKLLPAPPEGEGAEAGTAGITFRAFEEVEPPEERGGKEGEGEALPLAARRPECVFVENTIRQRRPALRFFGVPRLGQYLAVPFTLHKLLREDGAAEATPERGGGEGGGAPDDAASEVEVEAEAAPQPASRTIPVDYVLCMDTMGTGETFRAGARDAAIGWAKVIGDAMRAEEDRHAKAEKGLHTRDEF